MSSATSTEDQVVGHPTTQSPRGGDAGLRPWQFFLLAGMLSATGVVLVVRGQSPASIVVLSLTVVAASFVALGAYRAFSPLAGVEGSEPAPVVGGRTRAALEREKALALRSIKELEFDFAMKKIAKSDFEEMSSRLRTRAMGLMQQLDESGYRDEIERELLARLGTPPGSQAFRPGGQVEESAEEPATASPKGLASMQCHCGTLNDPDAKFCKSCGTKLVAA